MPLLCNRVGGEEFFGAALGVGHNGFVFDNGSDLYGEEAFDELLS